jgi:ubiquitin-protein ligase
MFGGLGHSLYGSLHKKKKGYSRQETPDTGVGYGGDDRRDKERRTQGRAAAAAKEMNLVKSQLQQLRNSYKPLATATEPPSHELVDTLKKVLRNHDPQQWSSSREEGKERRHLVDLVEAALHTCSLITKHHPKCLGQDDDDESILCALEELAQTSELLVRHCESENSGTGTATTCNAAASSKTSSSSSSSRRSIPRQERPSIPRQERPDVELAQQVLTIREDARRASLAVLKRPDCLAVNSHEHYRKALRPRCFDFVERLQFHAFAKKPKGTDSSRSKALVRELLTYKTALPVEYGSSILVRAVESRMDLLRVLIFGPESTPYANGCFLFDVYLPARYPDQPPEVKFLTTGGGKFRLNPNLYNCGKVCLSLLGTWQGPGWQPGESTLLQVLVSIQSLILVPDPYFNEPGFQPSQGTPRGTTESDKYNANIRPYTTSAAILPFLKKGEQPYPEFAEAVTRHYELKQFVLQQQLFRWNRDTTPGPTSTSMARLYSECWTIWDAQRQQQKQQRSSKRKRKPEAALARAAAAASATTNEEGVIVLGDSDDDDDGNNEKRGGDMAALSSNPKELRSVNVQQQQQQDSNGIIEIDMDEDPGNSKPPAIKPSGASGSTACETGSRAAKHHSNNNEVVDLT